MSRLRELSEQAFVDFLRENYDDEQEAFIVVALPVLNRVLKQLNATLLTSAKSRAFLKSIWLEAKKLGFSKPLKGADTGADHVNVDDRLGGPVLDILTEHAIADKQIRRVHQYLICKQFLRALTHPEVRQCTLSFRNKNKDHFCERQSLTHCKSRISGSHCEECPFFITLSTKAHLRTLKVNWHLAKGEALDQHQEVFLCEDFRELRMFMYLRNRYGARYEKKQDDDKSVSEGGAVA